MRTTPYPTYLDTLSAIAPDEGEGSYSISGRKRTANLFERIVVQDRSFDAFTSMSSCGTASDSFDTHLLSGHKDTNSAYIQYNRDSTQLDQLTAKPSARAAAKASYLTPFLATGGTDQSLECSNRVLLTSTQIQKLFDTTILIRNRLYRGQTLFYGASCVPIHLSSSQVSALVKYQTFDIDSFLQRIILMNTPSWRLPNF